MEYNIKDHLAYNVWANEQFARMLRAVSDVVYFEDTKSSFPSIAKTVVHIWGAQDVWFRRMKGENPGKLPSTSPDNRDAPLVGMVQSSNDLLHFAASKGDTFLRQTYSYRNMKGDPFEDTYEVTMFHVVNHSTYHRGQLTTMLRQAGVTALAATDLIHYLRIQNPMERE